MKKPKPFLKWLGGKSQLLGTLAEFYPQELGDGTIRRYVEPFLGGGAVFFDVFTRFHPSSSLLMDISGELILAYRVVQRDVVRLLQQLDDMQTRYWNLSEDAQKALYYEVRQIYNKERHEIDYSHYSPRWIDRAAQTIFLNKTCYNGLFRFNSKGAFNSPKGSYLHPKIFDEENLLSVSAALENAEIRRADFSEIQSLVDNRSFVYFDPPYKPLSKTADFTVYSKGRFGEADQFRLASLFSGLHRRGVRQMLSNSDPKNSDPKNLFFDSLYADFTIRRVKANRRINSIRTGRGALNEIIVTNY